MCIITEQFTCSSSSLKLDIILYQNHHKMQWKIKKIESKFILQAVYKAEVRSRHIQLDKSFRR